MAKIVAFPLAIIMSLLSFFFPCEKEEPTPKEWNTNYSYIFVHGLMGWGSYDFYYDLFPYWGTFGGNLLNKLNDKGFDCYAATVSGTASVWDRACELYAQLAGTVVDYGEEHSERCGHERFGEDFNDRALIEKWDSENKINLLGHSFGGATMRLFASLMAVGSEAEQAVTDKDEIGRYSGVTVGGYEFGEEWFENDGLVNTISAKAPTNARSKDFDANDIPKGVWNVMPTYHGDHMSLQGGLLKTNTDVERLYTKHLNMINCL